MTDISMPVRIEHCVEPVNVTEVLQYLAEELESNPADYIQGKSKSQPGLLCHLLCNRLEKRLATAKTEKPFIPARGTLEKSEISALGGELDASASSAYTIKRHIERIDAAINAQIEQSTQERLPPHGISFGASRTTGHEYEVRFQECSLDADPKPKDYAVLFTATETTSKERLRETIRESLRALRKHEMPEGDDPETIGQRELIETQIEEALSSHSSSELIRFVLDKATSRVRNGITVTLAAKTLQIIQRIHNQASVKQKRQAVVAAGHYLGRATRLIRAVQEDTESEFTIPSTFFPGLDLQAVDLRTYIDRAWFPRQLPVWFQDSALLSDSQNEQGAIVRQVSYGIRPGGINPQTGELALIDRLRDIRQTLAESRKERDLHDAAAKLVLIAATIMPPSVKQQCDNPRDPHTLFQAVLSVGWKTLCDDLLQGEVARQSKDIAEGVMEAWRHASEEDMAHIDASRIWVCVDRELLDEQALRDGTETIVRGANKDPASRAKQWYQSISIQHTPPAANRQHWFTYQVDVNLHKAALKKAPEGQQPVTLRFQRKNPENRPLPTLIVRVTDLGPKDHPCRKVLKDEKVNTKASQFVAEFRGHNPETTIYLNSYPVEFQGQAKGSPAQTARQAFVQALVMWRFLKCLSEHYAVKIEDETNATQAHRNAAVMMLRLDAAGEDGIGYPITHAVEHILGATTTVYQQGFDLLSLRKANKTETEGYRRDKVLGSDALVHRLYAGNFPNQVESFQAAVVTADTFPCDERSTDQETEVSHYVSRARVHLVDRGGTSGWIQHERLFCRVVREDERSPIGEASAVRDALGYVEAKGIQTVILLLRTYRQYRTRRSTDNSYSESIQSGLAWIDAEHPDMLVIPLSTVRLPGIRLNGATRQGYWLTGTHQFAKSQGLMPTSHNPAEELLPLQGVATLRVVDSRQSPAPEKQPRLTAYALLHFGNREQAERVRGWCTHDPARLRDVLTLLHASEFQAFTRGQLKFKSTHPAITVDPCSWAEPTSVNERGGIKFFDAGSRRGRKREPFTFKWEMLATLCAIQERLLQARAQQKEVGDETE